MLLFIREKSTGLSILHLWMDKLRFYVPFNSISVITGRWKGEHERLCVVKRRLGSEKILPLAGFESTTPWSEVGSANRSATRARHVFHL